MKTLQIETGVQEFTVKGTHTGEIVIRFSPTDMYFAQRLYTAFEALEGKQKEYETVPKMNNSKEAFEFCRTLDKEMRESVDSVFCAPVSEAVFGDIHAYSMSGGLPVWCNLIFAIMDEMDDSFTRERKATDPRLQKYIAKYHK